MIWFACKQCGMKQSRPESSIGTMVFCQCGQGNLVPWESNTEEPPLVVAELPPLPHLEPLTFPSEAPPPLALPERKPRRSGRREAERDPNFCFNHEKVAVQDRCKDCGEGFCQVCLVYVEGQALCGPCKNFRVRKLHQPAPASHLALVSFIVAFFTGPLAFCLFPMGVSSGVPYLSLLALLPQTAALILGILALRKADDNPKTGGQALALSGVLISLFLAFWTLFFSLYTSRPGA